jgi:hypothetical protein
VLRMETGALGGQLLRHLSLLAHLPQPQPEALPRPLDGTLDRGPRPDLGGPVRTIRR